MSATNSALRVVRDNREFAAYADEPLGDEPLLDEQLVEEYGEQTASATLARPARRPSVAYALLLLLAVGVVGAIQLGVSLSLAQGSYEIASLTSQSTQLSRTAQSLQEKLAVYESPQYLAQAAASLGMQSATSATFIRLSDGTAVTNVKTLSDANQKIANQYAITISGNLIANSNLTPATTVTSSAVASTKTNLGSALTSLIDIVNGTSSASTTSAGTATTTGTQATQAAQSADEPPMSSIGEATTGESSGSTENTSSTGVASGTNQDGAVSLAENQMPAPNSR